MPGPPRDPRYTAHFTDPLYDDVADDCAPFGSDQGSDLLHDVEQAGRTIAPDATIESLLPWGSVESFFADAERGDVDGLLLIYATGFLLLRYRGDLSGTDLEVLQRAVAGIHADLAALGHTEAVAPLRDTVLADLASYDPSDPGR
ncbi:hypothetical protein [Nocardioides marmoraquaticus]